MLSINLLDRCRSTPKNKNGISAMRIYLGEKIVKRKGGVDQSSLLQVHSDDIA
jgi:hypothetical protein